jgi:Ni/Co efflux regulator RcnB
MRVQSIVCAILAISFTVVGAPSFAQGGNPDQGMLPQQPPRMRGQPAPRTQLQQQRRLPPQQQRGWAPQRQGIDRGHARGDDYRDPRGAGPEHQFRRGDRLPPQYRHRNYVVDDWRGHHLSAPPRGYHWVQVGSDYVLVAIATGIIIQLLLNN